MFSSTRIRNAVVIKFSHTADAMRMGNGGAII
jgi:hypothetical protein